MKLLNGRPNFPQFKGTLKTETGSLAIPSRPYVDDRLLWHYTNSSGLLGIVSNDVLWASAANMLNDARELIHGAGQIEKTWRVHFADRLDISSEVKSVMQSVLAYCRETIHSSDTYVLCASLKKDSLSQWRGYGGSDGYAIGLDPTAMLRVNSRRPPGPPYLVGLGGFSGWQRVEYTPKATLRLCSEFLEFCIKFIQENPSLVDGGTDGRFSSALMPYHQMINLMKSKGFRDEREARFVVKDYFLNPEQKVVSHRDGPLGVTPYLKLTGDVSVPGEDPILGRVRSMEHLPDVVNLPIRAIVVGPRRYPDAAEAGLRSLLRSTQYEGVVIKRSKIPFR